MGFFNQALFVFIGPGKGTGFVTKDFTFHQSL